MKLLSVRDVADQTGLSRSTIYALMDAGRLRSVTIGHRRCIIPADLDAWISSLTDETGGAA